MGTNQKVLEISEEQFGKFSGNAEKNYENAPGRPRGQDKMISMPIVGPTPMCTKCNSWKGGGESPK